MRSRKFIIGFVIFDIVAVLAIVLVLMLFNPFKAKVAPDTDPTTASSTQVNNANAASGVGELEEDKMQLFHETPSMLGMREESVLTDDGLYYTSYRAECDLDFDGDGALESMSIELDDHSESLYVLVNDGGNLMDYVVPGKCFPYMEQYGAKACKGLFRGYTLDLDKNDPYSEVCFEMMRDTWDEYQTLVVRYDGTRIQASVVRGAIATVSNAGAVQFSIYDCVYGEHKLYKTYDITSETDFLKPQTDYFFADRNVEKTSYLYNPNKDIQCTNIKGEAATITGGSTFYWCRTDDETYVDIITTDNKVYRLPITKDGGEDGSRPVYHLGDTYAAEITTR